MQTRDLKDNDKLQPNKITYPTNCKNCGAVMKSCTCEYCGTTYTGYEEKEMIKIEPVFRDSTHNSDWYWVRDVTAASYFSSASIYPWSWRWR